MLSTYFLATVLGWYLVIISLFLILKREAAIVVMRDAMAQRSLLFLIAIITLIIGLLMVVSHNLWVMGWPVIITIFAWLALISGIIRLFFPDTVYKIWNKISDKSETMIIMGVILLIIGLFLLYKVYWG